MKYIWNMKNIEYFDADAAWAYVLSAWNSFQSFLLPFHSFSFPMSCSLYLELFCFKYWELGSPWRKRWRSPFLFQHFEAEVKAEVGDFSIMQLIHPPPFQTMCTPPSVTLLSTFPGLRRGKQSTSKIQVLWSPAGSLGGSDGNWKWLIFIFNEIFNEIFNLPSDLQFQLDLHFQWNLHNIFNQFVW